MSSLLVPRCVYVDSRQVLEAIPRLVELGLGIEVMFGSTDALWPKIKWDVLLGLSDDLADAHLPVSCHGPFNNLALAGKDAHIADYSYQSLSAGIEAARVLGSPLMVFHTGFLPQYPPTARGKWLDLFCDKLRGLLDVAADNGIVLAMENTYEHDTTLFEEVFARIQHPYLGMCLDTGHAACFARVPATDWIEKFSEQIVHLHLSDNDGLSDLHWGLGKGVVDLSALIGPLLARGSRPSVTFEVSLEDARGSNDCLDRVLSSHFPTGHE
ncbi:MAG: sugar phosphate isomerase/epimerase [Calditrichaeota bacterium]|nr:sugar phosphate isomerase/epimerase [Calditrichota bacterium]MCB9391515.1 sugar phosphate isomerase/epimerase [Calditrichota bacterium]